MQKIAFGIIITLISLNKIINYSKSCVDVPNSNINLVIMTFESHSKLHDISFVPKY